jgi:hypothetical protein
MTVTDQNNSTVSVLIRYWRCLRKSKDVSHRYLIGISRSRFPTHACVVFLATIPLEWPKLPDFEFPVFRDTGYCSITEKPTPYIKYDSKGTIQSRTLILDNGIEYPCNPRAVKRKSMTILTCGPLEILGSSSSGDYFLVDKNKRIFDLKTSSGVEYPSNNDFYKSDAKVTTRVEKWSLKDTDQSIRLRTMVECPAKNLPRPSL